MKKRTRIAALVCIILLLAMYGSTMVFALMDSPMAKGLFMGSVFCTIAVPVLLYGMILAARALRGRGMREDAPGSPETGEDTGTTNEEGLPAQDDPSDLP